MKFLENKAKYRFSDKARCIMCAEMMYRVSRKDGDVIG